MSNLLFENMIRVSNDKYICRIWQEAHYSAKDIKAHATAILNSPQMLEHGVENLKGAVIVIVTVSGVNSVEIVDRETGCGICAHKDWP